jgi:hypothetical protein
VLDGIELLECATKLLVRLSYLLANRGQTRCLHRLARLLDESVGERSQLVCEFLEFRLCSSTQPVRPTNRILRHRVVIFYWAAMEGGRE